MCMGDDYIMKKIKTINFLKEEKKEDPEIAKLRALVDPLLKKVNNWKWEADNLDKAKDLPIYKKAEEW